MNTRPTGGASIEDQRKLGLRSQRLRLLEPLRVMDLSSYHDYSLVGLRYDHDHHKDDVFAGLTTLARQIRLGISLVLGLDPS